MVMSGGCLSFGSKTWAASKITPETLLLLPKTIHRTTFTVQFFHLSVQNVHTLSECRVQQTVYGNGRNHRAFFSTA